MTVQLQGVAATASALLDQKKGDVGEVVEAIGGPLLAPHMDGDRIRAYFGQRRRVEGVDVLERIAREGVPADIRTGGDLASELAYGNHRSAAKYGEEVIAKAAADVALGRAVVFPVTRAEDIVGLRISPLGVVEEKEKLRVIHDLTFCGNKADERAREAPGERKSTATPETGARSVNEDTDWERVPKCALAGVMTEIIARILGLRAKFGTQKRILLQKMDVKSAFRQVGIAPGGAAAFAYRLDKLIFVDLRLQFGWRGSPGWWGVVAGAIQAAHRATTWESAGTSAAAEDATRHVSVAKPTGKAVEPLPAGCRVPGIKGGGPGDPAWVVFFVDDAISVEVQWTEEGTRCKALTASLADAHFQAMGERGAEEEPLVPRKKMTGWVTAQEILGFWVDTEEMTVGLPERKLDDLRHRLGCWPPGRREATVREVLSLAGKLHHAAYVVRPGRYFVHRLLRLANLHLTGEELRGGGDAWGRLRKNAEAERTVALTREFMADVGWWRWFVHQERWKKGERLTAPFFRFVKQEPSRRWFSDASYQAVGGFCRETGWWWRYGLSEEERSRTVRSRKRVGYGSLTINVLELFGMVWTAYVMIVMRGEVAGRGGEAVLMRGDNASAVQWVLNCKGGKDDVRAGGLMRILGALEVRGGWCFQAKHVAGAENVLADLITRCEPDKINAELKRLRPDVDWREQVMGAEEKEKCSEILRGGTRSDELQRRLEELTKELGGYG